MPGLRRFLVRLLVVCRELAFAGSLAAVLWWLLQPVATGGPARTIDLAFARSELLTPQEQTRRLIVGEWEDDYQAGRRWVLREDGTGTMVVHLSGIPAFMFAPKLTFEQTWRLEGDEIVMAVTSGEPQGKVDIILKMEGDNSTQRVVEVTDERFVVIDHKGEQFDWRRVPDSPADSNSE